LPETSHRTMTWWREQRCVGLAGIKWHSTLAKMRNELQNQGKNLLSPLLAIAAMILGASVQASSPNHRAEAAVPEKRVIADPVARLQTRLDQGSATLRFDKQFGYLPSVLKNLGISPSSQLLIFSKTSLQVALVTPQTPHAVYFTDDVAVGFVPGTNLLELASERGGLFLHFESARNSQPAFSKRDWLSELPQDWSHTERPGLDHEVCFY